MKTIVLRKQKLLFFLSAILLASCSTNQKIHADSHPVETDPDTTLEIKSKPVIWVTSDDRKSILENIQNYSWAKDLSDELHEHVDSKLISHLKNPGDILDEIPEFATNSSSRKELEARPYATEHYKVLSVAAESGMLYYLTGDEKYAAFTADILQPYIDQIAPLSATNTTVCGFAFYDSRTAYPYFALAYDFVHEYLRSTRATVYSGKLKKRVAFDNSKAQKAIINMIGNMLQEYGPKDDYSLTISNHPILTAPAALYAILCVEDTVKQNHYFDVFWNTGTKHQNSFTKSILAQFSDQGIWPESLSYSFMPNVTLVLNIVDRIKPELKVAAHYKSILNSAFLFENLRYPNRKFVRYGDSKRNNDFTGSLYRYTLAIADRNEYHTMKKQLFSSLKAAYDLKGGYHPVIGTSMYDNYNALQLFWGYPIPSSTQAKEASLRSTVLVDHAGIALERNHVSENNAQYGLCGIIGGGHYVHCHATGISMELYGAGYVMAPNSGLAATLSERADKVNTNYYRLYAGNNTVVVNGTSHGRQSGSWKDKSCLWVDTAQNIAAEPSNMEDYICDNFSFATQRLDDSVNDCTQERTLSVIRTSSTTGYYFDLFRSKSKTTNLYHDYLYHNIGDQTTITDSKGHQLDVHSTTRYQNDIGDCVQSPGWRFFEDTKVTDKTADAVKVTFDIKANNRHMYMFIPDGVEREYTQGLAPATREAINGYVDKKTQLLTIRQQGEAWDRPFISVFEPSTQNQSSVQSVKPLKDNAKIIGSIVSSQVNNTTFTDYIICQDNNTASYTIDSLHLTFTGRFGIVRIAKTGTDSTLHLYIGKGESMVYNGTPVLTGKGYKTL